ncbi:TetR family transcriptional regulator [Altererythrobacter xixiisoli]|uniref:TetR family transcriptional regulator n=1 Tax=Croceibacterium xixiisoli TaxID=1476466 RepID=A0A6I4TUV6_9SPHN|nr:TetR/AcrR family transcriptional regulator [Croceibacterium xixiisoli]MXP00046.1 TetR family transcriptional regulator [Croceibacterium xixiisoli]
MEKTATRGRPREFDVEQALGAALRVFWDKGYESASLTDLTDAMGITRPSLYAAFGNKEALFKRALDLYESEKLNYIHCAVTAHTAKEVARRLLEGAIDTMTGECRGCMHVTVSVINDANSVREEVLARSNSCFDVITARMQRAADEGDFTQNTDVAGLTRYLVALVQGMAVQSGQGATRAELTQIMDTALAQWPSR